MSFLPYFFNGTLLLVIIGLARAEYYHYDEITDTYSKQWCFDEAQRSTLHYEDTNETIPNIPTFSIWSGGWAAGYTLSILAHILLSEKVGVNVDFFPTHDVSSYWDFDTTYPQSMADWFKQADIDLAFCMGDQWSTQDIYDMIKESTLARASNGVSETAAFWIPDYLFERFPEAALYTTWKNNDEFRKQVADGLYPWTDANYTTNGGILSAFASVKLFTGVINLRQLAEQHELNFNFSYTNNEAKHAEFIKDLYDHQIDFITYSYTPHYLNIDVKMQSVKFPDNPSKTDTDECRQRNWCELADVTYQNMWRETDIINQWPEIREFMMRYRIDRASVENIMKNAYANGRYNEGDKFLWDAVCEWLRNETYSQTWQDWIPEIKRSKCPNGICDNNTISTLQLTIFLLAGILSLTILIYITYKISTFCISFQKEFGDVANLDQVQRLKRHQKRKIFITLSSRILQLFVGVIDFGSDLASMLFIVFSVNKYSEVFVWLYFSMWVISSIASSTNVFVTLQNIIQAMNELKFGMTHKQRKSSLVAELMFKIADLSKKIKGETSDIFVALFEDLPFLILNMYGLYSTDKVETVILISMLISTISIGYKMNISKSFFVHLEERQLAKAELADEDKEHSIENKLKEETNESKHHDVIDV